MHITKYFGFLGLAFILAGCHTAQDDWFGEYGNINAGNPAQMQYGAFEYATVTPDSISSSDAKRVAVLLPLSGTNATAGRTIRSAVEMAVLQRAPQNLAVSFYDTADINSDAINRALASNPEIIIGPLFANNARTLRDVKPTDTPVLSFTTDATALGGGVMTMSLLPTNSVEAIVQEMRADNVKSFIVLAPNTVSGQMMAGAARTAATMYDIPVSGVFYYNEKDSESIKATTSAATMNPARTAANTRAREILSDILTRETLTAIEKSSLSQQLERISRTDTLGKLPYDAVLFLGSGDDTRALASFLRYFGVGARDAKFYGTVMWDGSDIASDLTMMGAKFAALPPVSETFTNLYEQIDGHAPSRLATFGYDATNMAMGMIYSAQPHAAYLLNPSGYMGMDGLFRLKSSGENERALRIVQLDGAGNANTIKAAPANFMSPIYHIEQRNITPARAMDLETAGINPMNYIQIPDRLRGKYKSKTYGTHITPAESTAAQSQESIIVLPEDDREIVTNPEYKPVSRESVGRTYIDEIEIEE